MRIALTQIRIAAVVLLVLVHCATNHSNFTARRRRIDIGHFPGDEYRRQSSRPEDGDVYEFHRFQHYGYKTPSPSTFSLESMLAFLAPLATLPIIAGAALSSLASILPSLSTEGMVSGRSRREAVIDSLKSTAPLNASFGPTTPVTSVERSFRNIRDLDVIQKFLRQAKPREDYNDEVMATYLQCSGMLSSSNHCLERLVCQFSDKSANMPTLEKDVASLIIYTILNNKHINAEFKHRLRKAAFFGRDSSGSCSMYSCSKKDFSPQ